METLSIWSKNRGAKRGDVTPGIEFAKQLVNSGQVVAFPKRGSEANQLLVTGEIWMTTQYSQASLQLQAEGAPVATVYPEDGAVVSVAVCGVVRGGPNAEMAHEFLNLMLSEEAQREFSKALWSSPIYKDLPGLPPEYQTRLITTEEQIKRAHFPDSTEFAEFKAQWFKRWIEEVERGR
jgi:spermidine/putrescine-binding protein